jgi:hypothetical protein
LIYILQQETSNANITKLYIENKSIEKGKRAMPMALTPWRQSLGNS